MINMERTFFQQALNTSHCFLSTLFSGGCCTLLRLCSQVAKCPGVIKANDSEAAATCHSDHVMHCFPLVFSFTQEDGSLNMAMSKIVSQVEAPLKFWWLRIVPTLSGHPWKGRRGLTESGVAIPELREKKCWFGWNPIQVPRMQDFVAFAWSPHGISLSVSIPWLQLNCRAVHSSRLWRKLCSVEWIFGQCLAPLAARWIWTQFHYVSLVYLNIPYQNWLRKNTTWTR